MNFDDNDKSGIHKKLLAYVVLEKGRGIVLVFIVGVMLSYIQ